MIVFTPGAHLPTSIHLFPTYGQRLDNHNGHWSIVGKQKKKQGKSCMKTTAVNAV